MRAAESSAWPAMNASRSAPVQQSDATPPPRTGPEHRRGERLTTRMRRRTSPGELRRRPRAAGRDRRAWRAGRRAGGRGGISASPRTPSASLGVPDGGGRARRASRLHEPRGRGRAAGPRARATPQQPGARPGPRRGPAAPGDPAPCRRDPARRGRRGRSGGVLLRDPGPRPCDPSRFASAAAARRWGRTSSAATRLRRRASGRPASGELSSWRRRTRIDAWSSRSSERGCLRSPRTRRRAGCRRRAAAERWWSTNARSPEGACMTSQAGSAMSSGHRSSGAPSTGSITASRSVVWRSDKAAGRGGSAPLHTNSVSMAQRPSPRAAPAAPHAAVVICSIGIAPQLTTGSDPNGAGRAL